MVMKRDGLRSPWSTAKPVLVLLLFFFFVFHSLLCVSPGTSLIVKSMQSVVGRTMSSMDRLRGRRLNGNQTSRGLLDETINRRQESETKSIFQISSTQVSKQVACWRCAIDVALTLCVLSAGRDLFVFEW